MDFDARKTLLVSFFWFFAAICLPADHLRAKTADLTPQSHANFQFRVKTIIKVAGSLHVAIDRETNSIPLKVDAEMFFDERGLGGSSYPTLRHYWEAKADMTINGNRHRELRSNRQIILLSGTSPVDRFTSPMGPLTRQELELIDVVGSGFPLERLLPSKSMAVGESWIHDADVIAELLRLKRTTGGNLNSELTEINDNFVKINLIGEVTGTVNAVETKMEVVGNYQFDRRAKIVNWFALSIKEHRDISFATPGFDVVARIRIVRKKIDKSEALTNNVIKRIRLKPTNGDRLLEFVSEDNLYRMSLDRRWHLLSQRDSSALLRMVDEGDLIATCKVDRLNRMLPGKQITLEGFQTDVRRALDKSCEEIVTVSETVSPQGVRILRVEAAGNVGETPIRWVYCHLSNNDGQRLSFVFTHEASLEDRFAGVDESLTGSVQFFRGQERQANIVKARSR